MQVQALQQQQEQEAASIILTVRVLTGEEMLFKVRGEGKGETRARHHTYFDLILITYDTRQPRCKKCCWPFTRR